MVLILNKRRLDEIIKHSEELFPIEACGILVGRKEKGKKKVEEIHRTRNILNSVSRYQIHPEDQLKIFDEAERKSLEVIGFYHTHPFWSATVSSVDRDKATYPYMSYVIYSNLEKEVRSFIWDGKTFLQEKVDLSCQA
jgi:proteasome lid subunit RPN8/RPN11